MLILGYVFTFFFGVTFGFFLAALLAASKYKANEEDRWRLMAEVQGWVE